jgi:squalene synthase HpnC
MVDRHLAALIELPETPPSLEASIRLCRDLTQSHYENFTVASWLVPRALRTPLETVYAFCRTVDDIGDEAPGDRHALLDRFEGELDAAYGGVPRHPVLVALKETIGSFELPKEPFLRLIEANRMDQTTRRYDTFSQLLHYCEHSATPVGRLFLRLFGYRDEKRFALSDATCTALQLANFWQDVRRDLEDNDRIYLPREDMARFGVIEADLAAPRAGEPLCELLRFEVERTRALFTEGLELLARVRGRLRIALSLFSYGGLAVLDRIEAQGYDTLAARPTVSKADKRRILAASVFSFGRRRWTPQ